MDAAAALVHERGVAGTSLDDVRGATGTTTSQLYHSSADESVLVRAVVDRQVEQVLRAQSPELDRVDLMPALRARRDRVVALNVEVDCAGGCPLGRPGGPAARWPGGPVARWPGGRASRLGAEAPATQAGAGGSLTRAFRPAGRRSPAGVPGDRRGRCSGDGRQVWR